MRLILGQAGRVAAVVIALYGLALGISLVAFPPRAEQDGSLYAYRAWTSLYRMEPRYLVLNRAPLASPEPATVLLGASNVALSFDPAELRPLLGTRVHNLAIGGANVSELGEILDLDREIGSAGPRTYIVGLWYGLFIDDKTRWHGGATDIDVERLRYGLYRRSGNAIVPVVPVSLLPKAELALRPLLALDVLVKGSLRPFRQRFEGNEPPPDLDQVTMDEAKKTAVLDYWRAQIGTPDGRLHDEQFEVLARIVQSLADRGARVVLLDLPMPEWHRSRSAAFADYVRRLPRTVATLVKLPGVAYANLCERFADSEFYDEVHPRPRIRHRWAEMLAEALDPSVQGAPLEASTSSPR